MNEDHSVRRGNHPEMHFEVLGSRLFSKNCCQVNYSQKQIINSSGSAFSFESDVFRISTLQDTLRNI